MSSVCLANDPNRCCCCRDVKTAPGNIIIGVSSTTAVLTSFVAFTILAVLVGCYTYQAFGLCVVSKAAVMKALVITQWFGVAAGLGIGGAVIGKLLDSAIGSCKKQSSVGVSIPAN